MAAPWMAVAKFYTQTWERNKDALSARFAPREGTAGTIYRNIRGQTEGIAQNVTAEAARHKIDKPGGLLKHYVDEAENIWDTARGEGRNTGSNTSSNTGTGDIAEADTRSTIARAGRKDKSNAAFNRRGVEETMVNPNKGKKHTLLTRRKGGRGNTA